MRVEFLKPLNDWEDIYGGGLIKRYTKCPPSLEKHTLPSMTVKKQLTIDRQMTVIVIILHGGQC